jgi:isopentenyl diphosphate isomerase/L-lactate dehydrogenase-like FMN-dependent dehydrogenase
VSRALAILKADLVRTMKLLGCASLAELDESYLQRRG